MKSIRLIAVCILTALVQFSAYAQSLPVGTTAIEDYYRRSQLSGTADTNISFTIRPLFPGHLHNSNVFNADSNAGRYKLLSLKGSGQNSDKKLNVCLLPRYYEK